MTLTAIESLTPRSQLDHFDGFGRFARWPSRVRIEKVGMSVFAWSVRSERVRVVRQSQKRSHGRCENKYKVDDGVNWLLLSLPTLWSITETKSGGNIILSRGPLPQSTSVLRVVLLHAS